MALTSPVTTTLQSVATAFALAVILAPIVMRACVRIGWVDRPNGRKLHDGNVPLAGGMTIALAMAATAFLVDRHLAEATHFWVAVLVVFIVGFVDDRVPIRARYRMFVQLGAALIFLLMSRSAVNDLGELLMPVAMSVGILGIPVAMIGIAGLTNAVNMLDGIDGLAAGVSVVCCVWLAVVFDIIVVSVGGSNAELTIQATRAGEVAAMCAGALAAFLLFNQRTPWRSKAAMFLGDGGSMSSGFLIAAMLVYAGGAFGTHSLPVAAALWIAAIPLSDLFGCMLRRMLVGIPPQVPDRKHLHHLLLALGIPVGGVVVLLQVVAFVYGGIGVLGWRYGVADYVLFWGFVASFVAYFSLSQYAWQRIEARHSVQSPVVAGPHRASDTAASANVEPKATGPNL